MRWKRVQGTQYVLRTLWNVFYVLKHPWLLPFLLKVHIPPANNISKGWTLPNVLHDNSLCSALFLVLWQSLLCFSSCFFPEQNVSLLKWQAKKTGKLRLNTIVHYCDWLCSLKGSQSYKMCSLLGLEHLLEWIFNMPVEKPEEISSHLPTVNLGLKRNKIVKACSGFKKKKKSDPLYFFSQIILKSTRLLVYRLSNTSTAVSVEMCMRFFFFIHSNWLTRSRPTDSKCSRLLFHWHLCSSRPWLSRSHHWRWEWNRSGVCAAQTQTGSKEGIMSHLRCRPLVWKRALLR